MKLLLAMKGKKNIYLMFHMDREEPSLVFCYYIYKLER
jgi:hypothetical protein